MDTIVGIVGAGELHPIEELQRYPGPPAENEVECCFDGRDPRLNIAGGKDDFCVGIGIKKLIREEAAGNIGHSLSFSSATRDKGSEVERYIISPEDLIKVLSFVWHARATKLGVRGFRPIIQRIVGSVKAHFGGMVRCVS